MIKSIIQKQLMPRPASGYAASVMLRDGYERLDADNRIYGWLKTPRDPSAVVCFFHGNGENASQWVSHLDFVVTEHNCVLVLMEYAGYADPLEPLPNNSDELVGDAIDGIEVVANEQRFDGLPIILWGRSLGGAVATAASAKAQIDGLILESTFSSFASLASEFVRPVPEIVVAAMLRNFQFETAKTIKQVNCPVLIAHSADDEMIDYSHAQRNFEAANTPKQIVQLEGGHNDDKHDQEAFHAALSEFADTVTRYVGALN